MPWTQIVADANSGVTGDNPRELTYQQAIKETLDHVMAHDDKIVIMGQSVAEEGFMYGTTEGLEEKYGKSRVIETPIAEQMTTNMALGMSMTGYKPIVCHMRCDFLLKSADEILNHIAHYKEVFGVDTPIIIRAVIGQGWGSGFQHANNYARIFAGYDGLDVIMPSSPYEYKGMFIQALQNRKPTLIIEHRWLYKDTGYVPEGLYNRNYNPEEYCVQRNIKLAIITNSLSFTRIRSLIDGKEFDSVILIDIKHVRGFRRHEVDDMFKNVYKILFIENGAVPFGIGAEIIASIAEVSPNKIFKRIGWKSDTVTANNEDHVYLSDEEILNTIKEMIK